LLDAAVSKLVRLAEKYPVSSAKGSAVKSSAVKETD
jgi:hypothetical protein